MKYIFAKLYKDTERKEYTVLAATRDYIEKRVKEGGYRSYEQITHAEYNKICAQ